MIAESGQFVLIVALLLALIQATVPLFGAARGNRSAMIVGSRAAVGQAALLIVAFASLVYCFVRSDFSLDVVFRNSHSLKPLLYKITGTWGNHEGSMLLWVLVLSVFGAAVALFARELAPTFKARVLSVQGMICVAFLVFIVFTSNPFTRMIPAPADGAGLNPILQDPGLAFHPPLLYVGYVGFSVTFSFAVAALMEGRTATDWARWIRPWTLAAWASLTAGIALGSWWAYYELGWGGWWFWDPVENASFMPWLLGTALLHSAIVADRRGSFKSWTLLLAILTFTLSLLGTFLVRSGVLNSVHAFANDPRRGLFILAILAVTAGGALTLYAVRAGRMGSGPEFEPVSREGALAVNNMLLVLACLTVLLGTLYPLILDALSGGASRVSVGPPYFNATFGPIMVPLVVLVAMGPFLAWRRGEVRRVVRALRPAAVSALVATVAVYVAIPAGPALAPPAIGLAVWIAVAAVFEWLERARIPVSANQRAREPGTTRRWRLPLPGGMTLAHLGLAIMIVGITGVSAWRSELVTTLAPGESAEIGDYVVTLQDVTQGRGPNYIFERAMLSVTNDRRPVTSLSAERRFYPVANQTTTEAGIRTTAFADFYGVIGKSSRAEDGGNRWTVRFYVNPFMAWLWSGALLMVFGGASAFLRERRRMSIIGKSRAEKPDRARAGSLGHVT